MQVCLFQAQEVAPLPNTNNYQLKELYSLFEIKSHPNSLQKWKVPSCKLNNNLWYSLGTLELYPMPVNVSFWDY